MIETEIHPSPIHGIGTFLKNAVKKGEVIWRFDSTFDHMFTQDEVDRMPLITQSYVYKYSVWHEARQVWIMDGDNGRYFNHSETPNTVLQGKDTFSSIVAARDIEAGEELTSDYKEICDHSAKLMSAHIDPFEQSFPAPKLMMAAG
jgi:SET domain-containing protein